MHSRAFAFLALFSILVRIFFIGPQDEEIRGTLHVCFLTAPVHLLDSDGFLSMVIEFNGMRQFNIHHCVSPPPPPPLIPSSPVAFLPGLQYFGEAVVAIDRLNAFLSLPEGQGGCDAREEEEVRGKGGKREGVMHGRRRRRR